MDAIVKRYFDYLKILYVENREDCDNRIWETIYRIPEDSVKGKIVSERRKQLRNMLNSNNIKLPKMTLSEHERLQEECLYVIDGG